MQIDLVYSEKTFSSPASGQDCLKVSYAIHGESTSLSQDSLAKLKALLGGKKIAGTIRSLDSDGNIDQNMDPLYPKGHQFTNEDFEWMCLDDLRSPDWSETPWKQEIDAIVTKHLQEDRVRRIDAIHKSASNRDIRVIIETSWPDSDRAWKALISLGPAEIRSLGEALILAADGMMSIEGKKIT